MAVLLAGSLLLVQWEEVETRRPSLFRSSCLKFRWAFFSLLCRHYIDLPPCPPVWGKPGVSVVVHTEAGLQGKERTQEQNVFTEHYTVSWASRDCRRPFVLGLPLPCLRCVQRTWSASWSACPVCFGRSWAVSVRLWRNDGSSAASKASAQRDQGKHAHTLREYTEQTYKGVCVRHTHCKLWKRQTWPGHITDTDWCHRVFSFNRTQTYCRGLQTWAPPDWILVLGGLFAGAGSKPRISRQNESK